jgi:hypothetical protein
MSLGFDYFEHSLAVFETLNKFRKNPLKFFKRAYRQGQVKHEDYDYLCQLNSQLEPIPWSEEAYKCLYRIKNEEYVMDEKELNILLAKLYSCRVSQFFVSGEYDPEMTVLMLIKENMDRINLLLSEGFDYGTVCSYSSKPDIIILYLIKVL